MKTCRTCHQPKPPTAYHIHRRHADGLQSDCKDCANQIARESYARRKLQRTRIADLPNSVFWGKVDAETVERWEARMTAI